MRSRERFVLEGVPIDSFGHVQEFGFAAGVGGEFYDYSYS